MCYAVQTKWVLFREAGLLCGEHLRFSSAAQQPSVCLSVELPAATSSMGSLWQCCHSSAGPAGPQPSSQVMGRSRGPAQAGSSQWLRNRPPASAFATFPARARAACQGVRPGAGLRAQTPSLHAAKAAEKARAPRAVINLGCNRALLRAGGGDSLPALP